MIQSCNHYKTTKIASAAALQAERVHADKEKERLIKERKKEEDRVKKQEAADLEKKRKKELREEAKKHRKQQQQEAEKASEKGASDNGDEDGEKETAGRVRRGKGIDELTDSDPPLLREVVPTAKPLIVATLEDFTKHAVTGRPVVLRLARSVVKKVMEFHSHETGSNRTEINSVSNSFKTELERFISDFAEKSEARWYRAGVGWALGLNRRIRIIIMN